jgi:preprotein translocase subunit SecY
MFSAIRRKKDLFVKAAFVLLCLVVFRALAFVPISIIEF